MKNTLRHTFIFIVFLSIIYVFIGLHVSVKAYSNEDNMIKILDMHYAMVKIKKNY